MHREPDLKRADSKRIEVRLNPESRFCPRFDAASIAKYPVADWNTEKHDKMGMRVRDNFAEEHMM